MLFTRKTANCNKFNSNCFCRWRSLLQTKCFWIMRIGKSKNWLWEFEPSILLAFGNILPEMAVLPSILHDLTSPYCSRGCSWLEILFQYFSRSCLVWWCRLYAFSWMELNIACCKHPRKHAEKLVLAWLLYCYSITAHYVKNWEGKCVNKLVRTYVSWLANVLVKNIEHFRNM